MDQYEPILHGQIDGHSFNIGQLPRLDPEPPPHNRRNRRNGSATFKGMLHMKTSAEQLRTGMNRSDIFFKSYFRHDLYQEESRLENALGLCQNPLRFAPAETFLLKDVDHRGIHQAHPFERYFA